VSGHGRRFGAGYGIAKLISKLAPPRPSAQAIDFFGFDDNLSLPVLFGFFCWLSMYGQSADQALIVLAYSRTVDHLASVGYVLL
jgi:hypothetical protein